MIVFPSGRNEEAKGKHAFLEDNMLERDETRFSEQACSFTAVGIILCGHISGMIEIWPSAGSSSSLNFFFLNLFYRHFKVTFRFVQPFIKPG